MGISSGVGHFVQSIVEIIQGFFLAIIHGVQLVLQTVADLGKGIVHFVEGTLGFAFRKFPPPRHSLDTTLCSLSAADNFFLIGTILALVFGYMVYQQRQGTTPVSKAVKNK
jgi:phage-related protein